MTECELCGSTENVDQHHISYEHDVTVPLCRSCHQTVHKSDSHDLKPVDSNEKTTIEIKEEHRESMESFKQYPSESMKDVLQRMLDGVDKDELGKVGDHSDNVPPGIVEVMDATDEQLEEIKTRIDELQSTVPERTADELEGRLR